MCKRMTDISDGDIRLRIERRLEWKQCEQTVRRMRDRGDALASPGPDRGTHEVNRPDTASLELPLETQIEVRRVDADEHSDARLAKPARERAAQPPQLGNSPQNFGESTNGQRLERHPWFAPRLFHLGPRHSDESHAGDA